MVVTESLQDKYANYKKEQNIRQSRWLQSIRDIVGKCENCGSTENLTCHHIRKRCEGGSDNPINLTVFCFECHNLLNFIEQDDLRGQSEMIVEKREC